MVKSVNLFCKAHEVELSSARGAYGVKIRRKYRPAPYTVSQAKKILAVLNQRDRAICMLGLQTGQSVTQVLEDINGQFDYVAREIRLRKQRIRFDFPERKRNDFPYYTFCSVDAISEIQKWLPIRAKWLGARTSPYLFIKRDGSKLTPESWKGPFRERLQRHGVYQGPYTAVFHMFRKIFESEASPPDRGISKDYVRFMMGHTVAEVDNNRLDVPGGTYDQAPFTHSDATEREYQKLEPWLNIYSQSRDQNPETNQLREELNDLKRTVFRLAHNYPSTMADEEVDKEMLEEEQATEILRRAGLISCPKKELEDRLKEIESSETATCPRRFQATRDRRGMLANSRLRTSLSRLWTPCP